VEQLSGEVRERIIERKFSPLLTRHIALRARKYDELCREFRIKHSRALIVSLGCGFDTRFWRLGEDPAYMELDLSSLVRTKKEVLGKRISYELKEGSVLDEEWIEALSEKQTEHILFIAEGLFMYLPDRDVVRTLKKLADTFTKSRLVMEVVHEKYTRGWRKKMVERKIRSGAGSTAGDYYRYGIRDPRDLESYHRDFNVREAWSFFEDPDIRPAFLHAFRNLTAFSRTQYTVVADIV